MNSTKVQTTLNIKWGSELPNQLVIRGGRIVVRSTGLPPDVSGWPEEMAVNVVPRDSLSDQVDDAQFWRIHLRAHTNFAVRKTGKPPWWSRFLPSTKLDLQKATDEIMKTLTETLALVREERTLTTSLIALTTGLKARLDEILAGALTPAAQEQVNDLFAELEAQKSAIADAIAANTTPTPPAETPAPEAPATPA
jgi:hypothetical protein